MVSKPLPAIDADSPRLQPCEQRLALSASMAGDLLIEALQVGIEATEPAELPIQTQSTQQESLDSQSPGVSPDLVDQSVALRDSHRVDGSGQTVAVIDSGVAWDHVALGGGYGPGYRVVGGWDFAENDSDPYDDGPAGYHGTHIAGLLAGQSDGFSGVAPESDIVALRVFNDSGQGELQWIESALQWVHENQDSFESPITTVNLSVGAALSDANRAEAMSMLEDELSLLRQDNILVFAAAGNFFGTDNGEGVLYPASSLSVVPVASVDAAGDLSDFAQRESGIFASRGESIGSSIPDHVFGWDGRVDDFTQLDGTSMATPQVAAASMLVRQAMIHEGLEPTADEILARLRDSAITKVDPTTGATYHTIDLEAAVGQPIEDQTTLDGFNGTNQRERVELDLRDGVQLRLEGVSYTLEPNADGSPLVIDVAGGDDSLNIYGSDQAERLIAHAGGISTLTTNDFKIEFRGFENLAFDGGGGYDRASLFDSAGSDTLTSHPSQATLSGIGFQFDVTNVSRVYVHGTAGGNDTAFMHDGDGDDSLVVRPQFTSIRSSDAFQLAYGFEKVYAYANAGGSDSAQLYDSSDDDTLSISAGRSIITGPGYQVSARGFESTAADAVAGGNDLVRIYADQINSDWQTSVDTIQWTDSNNEVRIARGFERALAFEDYEPIELATQTNHSPLTPWWPEARDDKTVTEADASRMVFEQLGLE
ncbi:MAG: S8 family serine peptidase [Rubripirellula sp.]